MSEERTANELLAKSEQELRLLLETIPALVWRAGPEGNIEYVNKRVLEYLGERRRAKSLAGDGWTKSTLTTSHSRFRLGSKISNPEILTTRFADFEEQTVGIGGSRSAENHCEPAMGGCLVGAAS
jgi:PAS domain-containing protein